MAVASFDSIARGRTGDLAAMVAKLTKLVNYWAETPPAALTVPESLFPNYITLPELLSPLTGPATARGRAGDSALGSVREGARSTPGDGDGASRTGPAGAASSPRRN